MSRNVSSVTALEQTSFVENSFVSDTIPDCLETDGGFTLTPLGRHQVDSIPYKSLSVDSHVSNTVLKSSLYLADDKQSSGV